MGNIIIVSNRLPVSVSKSPGGLEYKASSGGLVSGLSPYAERRQTKWIGWPGIVSDELTEDDKTAITAELASRQCYPVFLTKKQVDEFYNGYSNNVLWPLFHNMSFGDNNRDSHWRAYRQVNKLFAENVLALSEPKSTIWVHDYQLFLAPGYIREERPSDAIGFFLHIPFPEFGQFRKLPQARSLIKGLLGADLIGFHTKTYTENFLDSCQEFKADVTASGEILVGDRLVRATDFPIGIDYSKFSEASRTWAVKLETLKLKLKYRRYKIILTVDRLDPSKGLVERLKAYRLFLEQNPRMHRRVIMLMLAVPSRTEIAAYRKLKNQVEKLVAEINDRYGTARWQPVVYMFKSVPFEELAAMYRVADVAFIAPLRDGMNVVAKEYVASKTGKMGALILSSTAGAAEELQNALIVNPRQSKSLVEALHKALTMRPAELKKRLAAMQSNVSINNAQAWAGNFMRSLQDSQTGRLVQTWRLNRARQSQLLADYGESRSRLLLLDYDGVLAPLESAPHQAKPSRAVYELLEKLAAKPANTVVVISGRPKADLQQWLGELPLNLVAEHGAVVRPAGKSWRAAAAPPAGWKKIILPTLEKFAAKTPGAWVEEKDYSLVWHYRRASAYHAQKNIVILKRALKPFARRFNLGVFSGKSILEIKSADAHKGLAISQWLKAKPGFVMAIGDDYTDEDMFEALPETAYSLKVGRGQTSARYRLANVKEVQSLLKKLTRY